MHNLVPLSPVDLNINSMAQIDLYLRNVPICCCTLPCTHHLRQHPHLPPTFCPPVFLVGDCVRAHVELARVNLKSHWTENHSSVCSTRTLLVPRSYLSFPNHHLCGSHIFHNLKFMYVCVCVCTYVCVCVTPHTCGGQRSVCTCKFSAFTMWGPGMALGSSDLAASAFTD